MWLQIPELCNRKKTALRSLFKTYSALPYAALACPMLPYLALPGCATPPCAIPSYFAILHLALRCPGMLLLLPGAGMLYLALPCAALPCSAMRSSALLRGALPSSLHCAALRGRVLCCPSLSCATLYLAALLNMPYSAHQPALPCPSFHWDIGSLRRML